MKSMKNIKKPSYAVNLGKGVFVGTTYIYQCRKCGLTVQKEGCSPSGSCPKGGRHDWTTTTC